MSPVRRAFAILLTVAAVNRYDVLTNGDQFFPAMLEAIRKAKRRISFETYIYDTGEVATQFTIALEEAARRGVNVNLVVDSVGASGMKDKDLKRLEAAGCHIGSFNSLKWYNLEEVNYRTHRKILAVDDEIGFTGGAGVADHWLGHAEDKDHWRDTQVRMHGPIVRLAEAGAEHGRDPEAGAVVGRPRLRPGARDEADPGEVQRQPVEDLLIA